MRPFKVQDMARLVMAMKKSAHRSAISALGSALGVLNLPLVIGLSVTIGCVILAALGLKIARGGLALVL